MRNRNQERAAGVHLFERFGRLAAYANNGTALGIVDNLYVMRTKLNPAQRNRLVHRLFCAKPARQVLMPGRPLGSLLFFSVTKSSPIERVALIKGGRKPCQTQHVNADPITHRPPLFQSESLIRQAVFDVPVDVLGGDDGDLQVRVVRSTRMDDVVTAVVLVPEQRLEPPLANIAAGDLNTQ